MIQENERIVTDRVIRIATDENGSFELNSELITNLLLKHQALIKGYDELYKEYMSKPPILAEAPKPVGKPDNRAVVSHGRYQVDVFDGFFIGVPVTIDTQNDQSLADKVNGFMHYTDMAEEDSQLAKMASIFGHGYELMYQDEKAQTNITYISPIDGFVVYDDSIRQRRVLSVYIYDTDHVSIQDDSYIYYFDNEDSGWVEREEDRMINPFGEVSMYEFSQNEERVGLFEPVMSLINLNNKVLSEKANEVDYFSDSYMKILGMRIDEDTLDNIRDNRIINGYGFDETSAPPDVDFLERPSADETQEHLLDRLDQLIYKIAGVTDITKDTFGQSSGYAREMKLQDMSNKALVKERRFERAMGIRWRLFFKINGIENDYLKLDFNFKRNLPRDNSTEADVAQKLRGLVSDTTLLGTLSLIKDVDKEKERIKDEENERRDITNDYTPFFRRSLESDSPDSEE